MLHMYENTLILGSGSNAFHFNTKDDGGAPITLAGTPSLACSINGAPAATAGLTLTVDDDSITGFHQVAIDVDNGTLALADGDVVEVYIAAGTVDSISVVGTIIARLSISDGSLLSGTQADLRSALGLASANLDTQLSTIDNLVDTEIAAILEDTGTTIPALIAALNDLSAAEVNAEVDTAISDAALATAAAVAALDAVVDAARAAIEADTQDIQTRLPASLNNGAIPADIQRVNDVELNGDGSATPWGP